LFLIGGWTPGGVAGTGSQQVLRTDGTTAGGGVGIFVVDIRERRLRFGIVRR
jgi:hypothetical protein